MDYNEDYDVEHRLRVLYQVDIRYYLRDTLDPFRISVEEFRRLYRLPQHLVMDLVQEIYPFAAGRMNDRAIPLEFKVLCALFFYASGSYQRPVGRNSDVSLSQASVSNCIQEVTTLLNHPRILTRFIHFPSTHEERQETIRTNSRLGMPRVLGFIDGTLVRIFPPTWEEHRETYYCRKRFTALNVQIVSDANLVILDVNAQFPGSANDLFIYRTSGMRDEMIRAYQETRCWFLGDSGYQHEPWLQTPLPHALPGTPEYYYTLLHCHCRNAAERCNGLLKGVWRCLCHERALHYSPIKAGLIVNACAVLHNFSRFHRVPLERFIDPVIARDADHENFHLEEIENNVYEVPEELVQQAEREQRYLIDHAFVQVHQ